MVLSKHKRNFFKDANCTYDSFKSHLSEIEAALTAEMTPFKKAELGWIMSWK